MPDDSLDILVRTRADTSGLKEVDRAQRDFIGTQGKGVEANEKAGKSFVEMTEHTRGFHRLIHQVIETSPALGLALQAAFSGPGAAIMALIMAVRMFRHEQEEAEKAAEAAGQAAAKGWGDVRGIINGVVDSIMEAEQAHAHWAAHVGEDTHAVQTNLDAEIAKLNEVAAAAKKLAIAKGEFAGDKEGGKAEAERIESARTEAELKLTQEAKEKARIELEAAHAKERAANAAAQDPRLGVEIGKLTAKAKTDAEHAAELKEKQPGLDKAIEGTWKNLLDKGTRGTPLAGIFDLGGARESAEKNEADRKVAEDNATRENRDAARLMAEEKARKTKEEEAKKDVTDKESQFRTLERKAEALKTKAEIERQSEADTEAYKYAETPTGKLVKQAVDAERAHEQHRQATQQQEASWQAVHQVMGQSADVTLRNTAKLTGNQTAFVRAMEALGKRMDALELKHSNVHAP